MSEATRENLLQILRKPIELAQSRGKYELNLASVLHKSFLLLDKEPKSVLQNEKSQMTRVDAARNILQGLELSQEKGGGVIGNIETAIELKRAADLLIHMETEEAKSTDEKPPLVYTEKDLFQMTFEWQNDLTKDCKPLRVLAEAGQRLGLIRLSVLEQVETALRRFENSKMQKSEQPGLEEALQFLTILCRALQEKGGLITELSATTDYKLLFEHLTESINNLDSTVTNDTNVDMSDNESSLIPQKRLRA